MLTYTERAGRAVRGADLAVMVLLSPNNDDVEYVATGGSFISRAEFAARQLRSVGVVALRGMQPVCAFKEPLPPDVVDAISAGFLEFLRVHLRHNFAEQKAATEVRELERMYFLLPDTRPN